MQVFNIFFVFQEWMARLDAESLDDSMRSKLVEFHKKVENVLNM